MYSVDRQGIVRNIKVGKVLNKYVGVCLFPQIWIWGTFLLGGSLCTRQYTLKEVEFDFILEYVLSAMIGIMIYWFREDKVLPPENLIDLMCDLMENGVMKRLTKHLKR